MFHEIINIPPDTTGQQSGNFIMVSFVEYGLG